MRWFKHLSASNADEKLGCLIDEHGLEGYGLWWILLEQIATQMGGEGDKCLVTYPLRKWTRSCQVSTRKFQKFTKTLAELGLISVKKDQNLWTIECRNLLKYRDEYTRKKMQNSGHSPDDVGRDPTRLYLYLLLFLLTKE